LGDRLLTAAVYIIKQGPVVIISPSELRQALAAKEPRANGMIPLSIDWKRRTIDGHEIRMLVIPRA
jgi:hypothetical protein